MSSLLISIILGELFLRVLNQPPELSRKYKVNYASWMLQYGKLNSSGYRDSEHTLEKPKDTFRIYFLGDSFTYGLLLNNPNDTLPKKIEKYLSNKLTKKVETINAAFPGFNINDEVNRFLWEGKYYHPDLVVLGLNYDEANISNVGLENIEANVPLWIKRSRWYQILIGGYLRNIAETNYRKYILSIYEDKNSKDWKKFSQKVLLLKNEAEKINASLALVIFPQIYPKKPNQSYSFYAYNKRFREFGRKNNIIIIDSLEKTLAYKNKQDLVFSPMDSHPTPEMNRLAAESFLEQFNIQEYINKQIPFQPDAKTFSLTTTNNNLGNYILIKNIYSNNYFPWLYFEEKNIDHQEFPTKNLSSQYRFPDKIITGKNNGNGIELIYHVYPQKPGIIILPQKIYGLTITGINRIIPVSDIDNGPLYADIISIIKKNNNIIINYKNENFYRAFRFNLSINAHELNIKTDGKIDNITKNILLEKVNPKISNQIIFPITDKITLTPNYQESTSKNYPYAFIDGVLTEIKKIKQDKKTVSLIFEKDIKEGQKISFYYFGNSPLDDNDHLTIAYEQ